MSVHGREMRHGHKSSKRRFDGHKAAVVVDTDTQLITAVDVLPGNAWDSTGALDLVEQSEISAGAPVVEAMGDTAYGDGGTRQDFADAGRKLVAWVPGRPNSKHFPKDDFVIDLAAGTCTCPAGQVTRHRVPMATHTDLTGRTCKQEGFRFDAAVCGACSLRLSAHPPKQEWAGRCGCIPRKPCCRRPGLYSKGPAYDEYRQQRVVAEHRLARLVQLGIRQARFFGHAKTRFQLYLAATVANLTLLADKFILASDPDPGLPLFTTGTNPCANRRALQSGSLLWAVVCPATAWPLATSQQKRGFRPNF